MIECMIMGDSIAHGVARMRPQCARETQVGINTRDFSRRWVQPVSAQHVLISLGSNDVGVPNLEHHLQQVRDRVVQGEVTWLLSANNPLAAQQVQALARARGDRVIHVRQVVGPDGVHPSTAGYLRLNQMWRPL